MLAEKFGNYVRIGIIPSDKCYETGVTFSRPPREQAGCTPTAQGTVSQRLGLPGSLSPGR